MYDVRTTEEQKHSNLMKFYISMNALGLEVITMKHILFTRTFNCTMYVQVQNIHEIMKSSQCNAQLELNKKGN